MLKLNLQFFAHKKGVGSTKNGRDSEAKRLGAKRADGQFVTRFSIQMAVQHSLIVMIFSILVLWTSQISLSVL